jgi:hypothetical protein
MAKVNFRQLKRQKEIARKQRQDERLARRGERSEGEAGEQPAADGQPVGGGDPQPAVTETKPVSEVS